MRIFVQKQEGPFPTQLVIEFILGMKNAQGEACCESFFSFTHPLPNGTESTFNETTEAIEKIIPEIVMALKKTIQQQQHFSITYSPKEGFIINPGTWSIE